MRNYINSKLRQIMEYIEFEESNVNTNMKMPYPHSHEFYELYFLLKGKRKVFVDGKMFNIGEKTLVVIPPYQMHKTEGEAYHRINVNISPSTLSKSQSELLKKLSKKVAVKISKNYEDLVVRLLTEGAKLQEESIENKNENLLAIANTILLFFSLGEEILPSASLKNTPTPSDAEVISMVQYINEHYGGEISIKHLCDEFNLSKVSICKKFKKVMKCSVNKYISNLRINKAKELLKSTKKSIEEISFLCGYSSANYFGLTFKKEVGFSPLNYRNSR